ncbi:hypothetical protein L6452_22625 [Arctium lappa]|uniref:Uncharacterized protein n=1 Tax=Arctium lappa TaxID=4217 RepID=A0ACB9AZW2_ARCLA|nr:hypothetical protein L6452_22625 [Arctium lappa]
MMMKKKHMKMKKKLHLNCRKLGGFTSETCPTQLLLQNCLKYSEKLPMWFPLRLLENLDNLGGGKHHALDI